VRLVLFLTVASAKAMPPECRTLRETEQGSHSQSQGVSHLSTGTVKWFNEQKGYGFITPDAGGEDLFIHHSNIVSEGFRTLQEGQKVDYVAAQGRKGPEATNVNPH
jgi:CspA family cold shock protein